MNYLLQMLPPELQSTPALVAGFLALLGLILCTAGIKVARSLAAALVGGALAMLAATIMPASMSIDPWTSAIIGLALGLLIGALAFRMMQGVVLALGLSVLAAGAFYEWQVTHNPLPAGEGRGPSSGSEFSGGEGVCRFADARANHVADWVCAWEAIPLTLRESMVVIGLGVAILAAFVAWIVPRQTTWLISAAVGAGMLLYGVFLADYCVFTGLCGADTGGTADAADHTRGGGGGGDAGAAVVLLARQAGETGTG